MKARLPLVLDDNANMQRLQPGEKVQGVPTAQDFAELNNKFRRLCHHLLNLGIELPGDLIEEAEKAKL